MDVLGLWSVFRLFPIFTDIFLVIMFEVMELTGVEYDEDSYNFSFTYVVEFIAMLLFFCL